MSSEKLFEGDFTKSEHWPRIRYGLPDKADILDAQHQTMSKFMIKEAEKREADQKMNMEKFEQLYSLTAAIAEKLEIDEDLIKAAKPSKASASKVKVDSDKKVVAGLDESFQSEVFALTVDYVDASNKKEKDTDLLKQMDSKTVGQRDLVAKWAKHVENKLRFQFQTTWEGLTEAQRKLLYFIMAKSYFHQKKASQTAVAGEEGDDPEDTEDSHLTTSHASGPKGRKRKAKQVLEGAEQAHTSTPGASRKREKVPIQQLDGTMEEFEVTPQSAKTIRKNLTLDSDVRRPSLRRTPVLPPSPLDRAGHSYNQRRQASTQSIFQRFAEQTQLPADDELESEGELNSDENEDDDENDQDVETVRAPFSQMRLSSRK